MKEDAAAKRINDAYAAAVERGAPLKPPVIPMFEPKALLAFQRAVRRRSIRPVVKEAFRGETK